jgi:phage replication-related protein YjqB (UPF0714/DUF867 family)
MIIARIRAAPAIALLAWGAASFAGAVEKRDSYRNFSELAAHQTEGRDFRVTATDRRSPVCALAIHGGRIEEGSEAVARAIAGDDLSLYVFEALMPAHNARLHITSARFDDPRAASLAGHSRVCVSIHGFTEDARDAVCVGGGNAGLRDWTAACLRRAGLPIEVETPCLRFGGADAANIVNRAAEKGVQIELSTRLRRRLLKNQALLDSLSRALREAASSYLGNTRP